MHRLLVLTVLLGFVIGACASSNEAGDSPTTSTTGEPSSPSVTAAVTSTTERPTATTEPQTTTTAAKQTGGDECLVGNWTLDSNAFVENFDAIMAEAGISDAEVTALDGSFTVGMRADGTYSAVRDAWGFRMAMADGTVIIEIDGEETGTWSTEASRLLVDPQESDLTVSPSMEVNGEAVPLPGGTIPVTTPPGIATDSEFECSGDVLTLTNSGVVSVLNRS